MQGGDHAVRVVDGELGRHRIDGVGPAVLEVGAEVGPVVDRRLAFHLGEQHDHHVVGQFAVRRRPAVALRDELVEPGIESAVDAALGAHADVGIQ